MKARILYIFFAALIILILISIWLTKESTKIQPIPEEKNEPSQRATEVQSRLPEYATHLPITSEKRSAITIIKPAPKEKPAPHLAQQSEEIQKPAAKPAASPTTSTSDSAPGITKIDSKHPSEIESKEMNQGGIVMW